MRNDDNNSDVLNLQLQIKLKKQIFDQAIRGDKEFAYVKKIYLDLRQLELQLEMCSQQTTLN